MQNFAARWIQQDAQRVNNLQDVHHQVFNKVDAHKADDEKKGGLQAPGDAFACGIE